jgi:hypothetical protein
VYKIYIGKYRYAPIPGDVGRWDLGKNINGKKKAKNGKTGRKTRKISLKE